MDASPLLQEFNPGAASLIVLWIVIWGIIGGVVTPRVYRRRDLDASNASLYGALAGAGTGPILLAYLWLKTPELTWPFAVIPAMMAVGLFYWAFITYHPSNLCSTDATYILSQMSNGVLIGILYGVIAIGLTLIFSILGIVSFAHGQFYMIGGYVAFFAVDQTLGAGWNPIVGILLAGLLTFLIGGIFEITLLRPMHLGKVERPGEYAILLTFGLAFFLEYTVLATLGANPRKLDPFFDLSASFTTIVTFVLAMIFAIGIYLLVQYATRWFKYAQYIIIGIGSLFLAWNISFLAMITQIGAETDLANITLGHIVLLVTGTIVITVGLVSMMRARDGQFNNTVVGIASFLSALIIARLVATPVADGLSSLFAGFSDLVTLPPSRVIAAGIGLIILAILLWFLNYTWMGKALRAVSQDKQAAAVVGINPLTMNTLAFGLGAMLAGLSGAALVQVLAWVPNISGLASARSFVVIVLGGMGSLPGAMVGGLIIGVVEALGVGCFPDVSRALAYQQVFGMIIFAIVLLLKPTGLFGREL